MKTNKIIVTIVLMLVTILLLIGNTNAAYQSIPTGEGVKAQPGTWMEEIRKMEGSGQGMGLNETINTSTCLATSASNNIDVHMLKNTEYGAIVLLGASDYGKQGAGNVRYMDTGLTTTSGTDVKASSTGNVYGIYELGYYNMNIAYKQYEWTAGGGSDFLRSIAPRYINRYSIAEGSARSGDATVETKNWMGSSNANWLYGSGYGFNRGYNGAFSYSGNDSAGNNNYCRAGVVVGAGL